MEKLSKTILEFNKLDFLFFNLGFLFEMRCLKCYMMGPFLQAFSDFLGLRIPLHLLYLLDHAYQQDNECPVN